MKNFLTIKNKWWNKIKEQKFYTSSRSINIIILLSKSTQEYGFITISVNRQKSFDSSYFVFGFVPNLNKLILFYYSLVSLTGLACLKSFMYKKIK